MKRIGVMLMLLVTSVILVACGSKNYDGTWNHTENTDEISLNLIVDGDEATMKYEVVVEESGFWSGSEDVTSGVLFKGEVKNSTLTITSVEDLEDDLGIDASEYQNQKMKMSLAGDSELVLTAEDGSKLTFTKNE